MTECFQRNKSDIGAIDIHGQNSTKLIAQDTFSQKTAAGYVLQAIDTAVQMNRNGHVGIPVPDYLDEDVSSKVVKIIQSYTGIVDRMVWRKR